jgi:hypothetical protein
MRLCLAVVLGLGMTSCGGSSGPSPDAFYFWRILTSTVSFGACSDAADFRMGAQPVTISDNSYLIYRVARDVHTAVSQTCTALDAATCSPGSFVWTIAGHELSSTTESKEAIETGGCSLSQTQTWTLTDQGKTMSLEVANVLSLVDAPTACNDIETALRARSPNMLGVDGCVVNFMLTGELR